jgi:hypothetical protein
MLVTTSAPIVEENSNANGKRQKGQFKKKATDTFKRGYTRVKEAGALPVIENLLGLNQGATTPTGTGNFLPPTDTPPPPPTGMSTTTKVVIGVLVLGAIVGGYYYFTKGKGKKGTTKK